MTELELLTSASQRAAARDPFVLATVTRVERSTPREPGAKMIVLANGAIEGTIGGGPLEAAVIAEAKRLLAERGASVSLPFALDASGSEAARLNPTPGDLLGMKCGGEVEVFLDVIRPPPRVIIYGAGHVGEKTAAVAGAAEIPHVVVDDRASLATRDRFPLATEVYCVDLHAQPLGSLDVGAEDCIVIVTRCHAIDELVFEAAVRSPARYVGLIGSRRKIALISRSMEKKGLDPRGDPRVHAPIGLDIGTKAPGQIAIAILGEVLSVLGGKLQHRRLAPHIDQVSEARNVASTFPATRRR